jgi:hypothetical protein
MGLYEFVWPHPAGEVIVTGTFDEWRGSVKLQRDNENENFSVSVDLGNAEKVLYKYIVNGNWTVNFDGKREYDHNGNENNVLYPEDMHTEIAVPQDIPQDIPQDTPVPSIYTPALDEPLPVEVEECAAAIESEEPVGLQSTDYDIVHMENEVSEESDFCMDTEPFEFDSIHPGSDSEEVPESQQLPEPQHNELEEETIVIADEPAEVLASEDPAVPVKTVEPENQPPVLRVSPTMSPLTAPAAPTTHVYTTSVPGATWHSPKSAPAPSTRSSSEASSHSSQNEKRDLFKERTPEKKREKRRSVLLGRILNFFK